jgi:spoIIIJ-associated protein
MEWVETTGKSLDEAKDEALDRLGIVAEDAEFEVLEEPRTGLFGRMRGVARVRARVRPAAVRPKQDRRGRRRSDGRGEAASSDPSARSEDLATVDSAVDAAPPGDEASRRPTGQRRRGSSRPPAGNGDTQAGPTDAGAHMNDDLTDAATEAGAAPTVDAEQVEQVKEAALSFSDGLLTAFRLEGSSSATVDGNDIEVRIDAAAGHEGANGLGLLIGPGGRTLLAIQDLARVAAQRRLGDHETRLRIDVAGYREKRRVALERFARSVAEMVKESGVARSLDPMPSADRKVIHDALTAIDGVTSRSEGEDPNRRIIVSPA